MTQDFVKNVKRYAEENDIPIIHFDHGQRKDDIATTMHRRNPAEDGVVFIGFAQEKASAFKGRKKNQKGNVGFDYSHQSLLVNHYYFYLNNHDFGPAFIKIVATLPLPLRCIVTETNGSKGS
jgi:hypothetical protein